jgi:hypothetical protein
VIIVVAVVVEARAKVEASSHSAGAAVADAAILGELRGKSGRSRGGSAPRGEGWKKNPLSAMAARSASPEDDAGEGLKASPVRGVTGLSLRDGKSRTLGERISGVAAFVLGDGGAPIASGAIILRFLRLLRRSYSLNDGFLGRHGPLVAWLPPIPALLLPAVVVTAGFLEGCSEPVSIWTTCLKEVVSA